MDRFETGVALTPIASEKLESTLQGHGRGRAGKIHGAAASKDQDADAAGTKLMCTSFDWNASWSTTSDSPYEGRASMAYLLEHPAEERSTHVVT